MLFCVGDRSGVSCYFVCKDTRGVVGYSVLGRQV